MEDKNRPAEILHRHLTDLAEAKDYFALREAYLAKCRSLDARYGLYWQAVYNNLFGRDYASTVAARKFITRYGENDGDSAEMLNILALNRLRRFRYRAAATAYRKLLRFHGGNMSREEKDAAAGNLAVCTALKNVPRQTVERGGLTRLPVGNTSFGHITTRVGAGNCHSDFLVDTGANFSTVGRTMATAMGLRTIASSIEVGTATGVRLQCSLAYAPELDLSGITVRNAVFLLMEDDQLDFPELNYRIDGIIGLPVIRHLGDMKFFRNHIRLGNVRVPEESHGTICIEGLMPLARVAAHGQPMTFTLDTGANQSEYSYGYYEKNREVLELRATKQRGLRGGGGGTVRHKTLMLRNEKLFAAGRAMTVPAMNVILDDYEFSRGKDGNLGLDALMSTGSFSISFSKMALLPGKKRLREKKGDPAIPK